jgi:hypothetical protein
MIPCTQNSGIVFFLVMPAAAGLTPALPFSFWPKVTETERKNNGMKVSMS